MLENDNIQLLSHGISINQVSNDENNIDIQNIFEEINRLQKTSSPLSDDHSIEEILSEAEKLVNQSENVKKTISVNIKSDNKRRVDTSSEMTDNSSMVSETSQTSKATQNEHKVASGSLSKNSNIYDLKQTLQKKSGSFSKEVTPRNPEHVADDGRDAKVVLALKEELKDTNERLKSLQLMYDNLLESSKQTKSGHDNLSKTKLALEAKIIERDSFLEKMRKELDTLKSFKSQFDDNEEKLKQEVAKLKEEKSLLCAQASKDKVAIQDLQRQCKEMEGILSRRHPDSVSALIVASKNPPTDLGAKELLEKRITFLENELKEQESKYKNILSAVQDKVNGMKENYETHISDLEKQVVTLQRVISESKQIGKAELSESAMQTDCTSPPPVQTQVVKPSVNKNTKQQHNSTTATVVPTNALARSESHLIATIKGLNTTLAQKEKIILKMTRDLDESKRHLSKLQKDKELNLKAHSVEKTGNRRPATSRSATVRSKSTQEIVIRNTTCNKENELKQEAINSSLKKDLSALQSDYEKLKKKRIEDLYALQAAHEKELMTLNVKVLPLQEDIDKLTVTIDVLKNQIKDMEDQMSLVVMERDQYKNKVDVLSSRVFSYNDYVNDHPTNLCQRNGDKDYDFLKMKVSELERRYEGRELRLKTLIDSLAKLKNSQVTSSGSTGARSDNVILPGSYLPF